VVRHFRDTSRTICAVAASRGLGDGAFVATLRLRARSGRDAFLHGLAGLVDPLASSPSIVAVHVLEGQGGGGNGQTAEKELRGRPDETVDWILLVEAADLAPLEAALEHHVSGQSLEALAADFEPARDCGIYRFQFGLASNQLA
jgi:hypothetical protein